MLVRLVWGDKKGTLPLSLAKEAARQVPQARLLRVDAEHSPHQEHPERVLPELKSFLDERLAEAARHAVELGLIGRAALPRIEEASREDETQPRTDRQREPETLPQGGWVRAPPCGIPGCPQSSAALHLPR